MEFRTGLLVIGITLSVLLLPLPAFGETGSVTPQWTWYAYNFVEDITERLTQDPVKKAELQAKHAQRQQTLIDQIDKAGLEIPEALEERREAKIQKIDNLIANQNNIIISEKEKTPLQEIQSKLTQAGELNKIRILYSQLPDVITADDATKQAYNQKVNAMESWNANCIGEFNVQDYGIDMTSWEDFKNQCPALHGWEKNFGFDRIKSIVSDT